MGGRWVVGGGGVEGGCRVVDGGWVGLGWGGGGGEWQWVGRGGKGSAGLVTRLCLSCLDSPRLKNLYATFGRQAHWYFCNQFYSLVHVLTVMGDSKKFKRR